MRSWSYFVHYLIYTLINCNSKNVNLSKKKKKNTQHNTKIGLQLEYVQHRVNNLILSLNVNIWKKITVGVLIRSRLNKLLISNL